MYKYILLFFSALSLLSASENIDAVTAETAHYTQELTSSTLKNTKVSYDVPAISYIGLRKNYIFLAALKVVPKQKLGESALGAVPIKVEQEAWKYELGAGYKFYLNKNLYVSPALLYSDYYSKTYMITSSSSSETKSRDVDVRLYGLIGYEPFKATMVFITVELDNDIFSDSYDKDYSQYPVNVSVYQFISKDMFLYIKYQKTLRDKKATAYLNGTSNSAAYFFGAGFRF